MDQNDYGLYQGLCHTYSITGANVPEVQKCCSKQLIYCDGKDMALFFICIEWDQIMF